MVIANWNSYPRIEANLWDFRAEAEALELLHKLDSCIPRGMGRSYGDCSLASHIISTPGFNRFISLDQEQGILECEAGTSLKDILRVILPLGWFLPVTPGTKYITLGGAIASDVHGKNHHIHGAFGSHVHSLRMLTPQGEVITCSREQNPEVFSAVCGGMGLVGLILSARIRLMPIHSVYIRQKTIPAGSLDQLMELFELHEDCTYSVAWMDCLSKGQNRGLFMLGEHCTAKEAPDRNLSPPERAGLSIPGHLPGWVLSRAALKAFNSLYYTRGRANAGYSFQDLESFFYPLDRVQHWNRLYGSKGFLQYQFVLPKEDSRPGLKRILDHINSFGLPPYLAVLKLLGSHKGLLSFPMRGYTLALDFPMKPGLTALLNTLDQLVHDLGGRVYLAKDARMNQNSFIRGYPESRRFLEIKHGLDPDNKMTSLQSKRLGLCAKAY